MTEIGSAPPAARPARLAGHIVVVAAPRIDDLSARIVDEVGRSLAADLKGLCVGTTSVAPRDEAARAARWVARLGARLDVPTLVSAQTSPARPPLVRGLVETARGTWVGREAPAVTWVGVSRLDLTPEISAVDQPYAVGIWLPLRPGPASGRRPRPAPDVALVEAAWAVRPVCTLLIGAGAGMAIALIGSDLLATEVLSRALRAAAQPVGDLGLSPWEAPVVQRGIEIGAGVTHPDAMQVESLWLGDDDDARHERFHRVVATAAARAGVRG